LPTPRPTRASFRCKLPAVKTVRALAVSVVHLIVYTLLFFLAVRRIRRPVVAAGVIAGVAALSFVPIYGSGEDLAAGGKVNRNADQAYSDAFGV
jgi:hypothetical protein